MKILNERYKDLVPNNIDDFISDISKLKQTLNFKLINEQKPLLIYTRNQKNQLYYLLSVNYSLQRSKVLNYTVITGQTFTRQHFADEDKDRELYDKTYYDDLVFISLSQSDYTSEYMENLIIDLVDFRNRNNKLTVITYDLISSQNYKTQTRKLNEFFSSNHYTVLDLTEKTRITSKHSEANKNNKVKVNKSRRIL